MVVNMLAGFIMLIILSALFISLLFKENVVVNQHYADPPTVLVHEDEDKRVDNMIKYGQVRDLSRNKDVFPVLYDNEKVETVIPENSYVGNNEQVFRQFTYNLEPLS